MKKMILLSVMMVCAYYNSYACEYHGFNRTTRISGAVGIADQASAESRVTSSGNVTQSFNGGGVSSTFGLGMHIEDGLWGDFSMQARALEAETEINTAGVATHSAGVMPIMIGLRFYPFFDNPTHFQPFVFLQGGPIIAFEESNEVNWDVSSEAHTETTMGYQYGGGVNLLLTDWLAFDVTGGYLKMNKLKNPINGAERLDGWDLSFGLSLFWGRQ